MAFNPGPITPNRVPELMMAGAQAQGQMYAGLGKSLGQGIQDFSERKEKAKEAESTAKALETIIRNEPGLFGFDSGSPEGEDAMEAFLTRGADESAIAWNSKLKNFLGAKITATQIKEAQQQSQARQMQMEEMKRKMAQQAALQPQIDLARQSAAGVGGGVLRADVQDNPFFKTMSQMMQSGLQPSPEVVADFVSKQNAAGAKSPMEIIPIGELEKRYPSSLFDVSATPAGNGMLAIKGVSNRAPEKDGSEQQKNTNAQHLRTSFYGLQPVKDWQIIDNYFNRGVLLSKQDSGAADIGLLFSYMKMLDPTSVVREGEYATAQNSGSVPETVTNWYNRAVKGERLTSDQRDKFLSAMRTSAEVQYDKLKPIVEQHVKIAKDQKIDPSHIVPDYYQNWTPFKEKATGLTAEQQRRKAELEAKAGR